MSPSSPLDPLLQELARKDFLTYQHTVAVAEAMHRLAGALGLGREECSEAALLGTVHDFGKLRVDAGLFKKLQAGQRLGDAERAVLRTSPEDLLAAVGRDVLPARVQQAVEHMHCRYDGSGSPPLAGEAIPLLARLLLVVDHHDMFARQRTGRSPLSRDVLRAMLVHNRGRLYDPAVVDAFLRLGEAKA